MVDRKELRWSSVINDSGVEILMKASHKSRYKLNTINTSRTFWNILEGWMDGVIMMTSPT